MNRFGPTQAHIDSSIDRMVNSWQAGRHAHIDTVMDLQARGYSIHQILKEEREVIETNALDRFEDAFLATIAETTP